MFRSRKAWTLYRACFSTMALPPVTASAAPRQLSVIVASRNGVKINAVAAALQKALPGIQHHVTGADSQSGVPDQPFGDAETLRGAFNRVASIRQPQHAGCLLVAIEGGVGYAPPLPSPVTQHAAPANDVDTWQQQQQSDQPAPLGGPPAHSQKQRQQLHELGQEQRDPNAATCSAPLPQLECFAWVVVQAPSGATSHARTASFVLPAAVSELMLRQGLELGDADDAVFGRVKSGQGSGTIGQLTGGLLTRQSYYEHAALCALIPLLNPHLYPGFGLDAAGKQA